MPSLSLQTTQNVQLEYEVANIGDRILAQLIDLAVFFVYFILVLTFIGVIAAYNPGGETILVIFIIAQIPIMLYSLLCELIFNGQTLGKYFLKVKVIKIDGSQPNFISYFTRWIMRIVDIWLFSGFVAIVSVIVNGRGQRLGDIAAGTTLIKLKSKPYFTDSVYRILPQSYQLNFQEVKLLTENDINIINDVLKAFAKVQNNSSILLLKLTADEIKKKTGIENTQHPRLFLDTIIRDYNFIHKETVLS